MKRGRERSRHRNVRGHDESIQAKVRENYGDILVLSNENDYKSRPISAFKDIDLPSGFFKLFEQMKFEKPTKIQSIAIPIALESYDIIGVAKTGSGKTLSFVLPILMAIQDEKEYCKEKGTKYNNEKSPRALVLAPTRELACQIYDHALPFAKIMDQDVVCVYGGADARNQRSELARGVDLLVATPGRLHDLVQRGNVDLGQVFIFVLDEADRMLDMGFLPQVKSISDHLKNERQTLLWSATWPPEVNDLSKDLCKNKPITIMVGEQGLTVNSNITQHVKVCDEHDKKKDLLRLLRTNFNTSDKVIIFSTTKKNCEFLAELLSKEGFSALAIHGDKQQSERDHIIESFKGKASMLVATDVASRGLDIKNIKAVINYDFPSSIEDYIHRIGRTGRAGAKGESFTYFTQKDSAHASGLATLMKQGGQSVPAELLSLSNHASRGTSKPKFGRWDDADTDPWIFKEKTEKGGDSETPREDRKDQGNFSGGNNGFRGRREETTKTRPGNIGFGGEKVGFKNREANQEKGKWGRNEEDTKQEVSSWGEKPALNIRSWGNSSDQEIPTKWGSSWQTK